MNFPRAWARLPGPADFLDTVFEDLTDRVAVFAGLPDEVPPDVLAVEMADLVKLRSLGTWSVVRSSEACSTAPSDSIERRIDSGNSTGLVLWIDATVKVAAATAWVHHATRLVEFRHMPRIFIAMSEACAIACGEEKRIRRRLWRDFVTKLDSRALLERIGRRAGHRPLHLALKSTLVAEIVGADLAARGKSPSSIGPIECKIRRQVNGWKSVWQSVSDQRDGKTRCSWRRVRFAA